MSVATETQVAQATWERVEEIEAIAASLPEADERRARLMSVAQKELAAAALVRPRIAASLLGVTEKTVRAWAEQGVLTTGATSPRLLLEPARLHQVVHLVRDLRAAGATRGLVDEVYRRLADQELLQDADLVESLAQMRRGEATVLVALPPGA